MYQTQNPRKYSIQQNYDLEQISNVSIMFSQNQISSYSQRQYYLKLNYIPEKHSSYLINYCFRCHKTEQVQFYKKFKKLKHNDLQQPRISNCYQNQSFINLSQFGAFLEGKIKQLNFMQMDQSPKNLKKMLDDLFAEQGFIPNFQRFLLFYPLYLEKYLTYQKILFEDNRLDSKIAYFLGILGCAELGSAYGLNRMVIKFIRIGGNVQWITQRKYPTKIRKLLKLNRKLARAIWQINPDFISQILQTNLWTQNQLALCIQILSFSHCLSAISLAIGLNLQQIDNSLLNFQQLIDIKNEYNSLYFESGSSVKLAELIQNISKLSQEDETAQSQQYNQQNQQDQQNKKIKQVQLQKLISIVVDKTQRSSQIEQNILNYKRQIGHQLINQKLYFKIFQILKSFLQSYQVVQKRSQKDYPPKESADINFKFKIFPKLYNLTNNIAQKALDLINYSQLMTSNNFGAKDLNTKAFRKAIRYYSENLCGYFHRSYEYKNITKLMNIPLRFYIRLLTLSPLHINKQVIQEMQHQKGMHSLFDLGHVAIITANCKMGLALTYAIDSFEE